MIAASDRFIRMKEVEDLVGLKNSALYQLIKRGDFPKQVKLGSASRWSLRAVETWMSERGNPEGGQPQSGKIATKATRNIRSGDADKKGLGIFE